MGVDVSNDIPGPELAEVIRNYEPWRKLANLLGAGPYDLPDWEGGRLYFRADYSEKLKKWPEWAESGYWGAWIIAPKADGFVCVLRSLLHERESERTERIEVMFSQYADAGKFIIFQLGNTVRSRLDLETLYIKWDDRGMDSRIQIEPASRKAVDFLTERRPTLKRESAERNLKTYALHDDPSAYGLALPADQVNMEVLALSFEELTAALLEGMPESITSQVARWRD